MAEPIPASRRWRRFVIPGAVGAAALAVTLYLFLTSLSPGGRAPDRRYDEVKPLTPDLSLVLRHWVGRPPTAGKQIFRDVLGVTEPVEPVDTVAQMLLRYKGRDVWSVSALNPYGGSWDDENLYLNDDDIHVSPDGRFVALEQRLRTRPLLILNLETGDLATVSVPAGVPEDHYYVYPFQFAKWAEDSSAVLVRVEGSFVPGWEMWSIDPRTGRAVRLRRQTQP